MPLLISRARKITLAGTLGVVSIIAGTWTLGVAAADPVPTEEEALPPLAVETFDYPDADRILKEQGIALRKGDGHILLADCSSSQNITVYTRQNDEGRYCFKVTGNGKSGYLTLEIPNVFNILTEDYAVQAQLTSEGNTQTVDVPKNGYKEVGEGTVPPSAPTVLVDLRVTG
ncbi:hypothetical protein AB0I22_35620 [Streptomyces sp. NPDC050610]|uniref:hypothetical protein n=1 Tax=Streptomyces sp. NPDC050610 TaxID=3157097 RepID=UPI0034260428